MSDNPAAPERNLHHMGGYRNEQDFLTSVLGNQGYDPDATGNYQDHNKELKQYDNEREDRRTNEGTRRVSPKD